MYLVMVVSKKVSTLSSKPHEAIPYTQEEFIEQNQNKR